VLRKFDMEMFEMEPKDYTDWVMKEIDRQQRLVAEYAEKSDKK
jgi:hypothetical protein